METKVYEDAEDGLGPLTVARTPQEEFSEDEDTPYTF